MTTSTGAPDLGNILDAIFKNPFKAAFANAKTTLTNLAATAKSDVMAAAQEGLNDLVAAQTNAAAALNGASAKIIGAINPLVQNGVKALATTLEADVPGIAPLIVSAEPGIESKATDLTDAVLLATIQTIAAGLSNAAKTTAAINLSTLAGAK